MDFTNATTFSGSESDTFFLLKKDVVRAIFCPIYARLGDIIKDINSAGPSMEDTILSLYSAELQKISKRIRWYMKLIHENRYWTSNDFLYICDWDTVLPRFSNQPRSIQHFIKFNLIAEVFSEVTGEELLKMDD